MPEIQAIDKKILLFGYNYLTNFIKNLKLNQFFH